MTLWHFTNMLIIIVIIIIKVSQALKCHKQQCQTDQSWRRTPLGRDSARHRRSSDWPAPEAAARSDWPASARSTLPPTEQLSDWPGRASPPSTDRLFKKNSSVDRSTTYRFYITSKISYPIHPFTYLIGPRPTV